MPNHNQTGFTLVELLLVVALFVILLGLTAPLAWSFVRRNDLVVTQNVVTVTLRRAQGLATDGYYDSPWGIKFQDGMVTLFAGGNFLSRDTSLDESTALPDGISVEGADEIVFEKISGTTNASTSTNFSNSFGQSQTVMVHANGMVEGQ